MDMGRIWVCFFFNCGRADDGRWSVQYTNYCTVTYSVVCSAAKEAIEERLTKAILSGVIRDP